MVQSNVVEKGIKERYVENLWNGLESAIVSSCSVHEVVLIMKEVIKRVRQEMGVDDAFVYYSEHSVFMHQFNKLLLKHIKAVKIEAHAGILIIDGITIKPVGGRTLEEDISQTADVVSTIFKEDGYVYRERFANALSLKDYDTAESIIEERARSIGENNIVEQVEIENWRINLVILMGDIAGLISLVRKATFYSSDFKLVSKELLIDVIKEVLCASMISGISVTPIDRTMSMDEIIDITSQFWDLFLECLSAIMQKTVHTMTVQTFQHIVVEHCNNIAEVMNQHLDSVVEVVWLQGK